MNSTLHPRITPISFSEMSEATASILKSIPGEGLKGKYAPVNVLGTLMYGDKLLKDFLTYWVNSKNNMSLSVREQELVILRMALHYECEYVWKHHVPVAQEFSVTQSELEEVRTLSLSDVFSEKEKALLLFTDEMVLRRKISSGLWDKYKSVISNTQVIDLIHLISQYVLFALTNNVFQVEIESSLSNILSLKQ